MRKTMLLTSALALALAAAGPAVAGGGSVNTQIEVTGLEATEAGTGVLFGVLNSARKCERRRQVQLINKPGGGEGKVLVDSDISSDKGAWAFQVKKGDLSGEATIKVLQRQVGNATCKAAKKDLETR